jgi:hypothetical protein
MGVPSPGAGAGAGASAGAGAGGGGGGGGRTRSSIFNGQACKSLLIQRNPQLALVIVHAPGGRLK